MFSSTKFYTKPCLHSNSVKKCLDAFFGLVVNVECGGCRWTSIGGAGTS